MLTFLEHTFNILKAVGLTSRHLIAPVSEHQDTVGPLARTVKDDAYILQAIAGVDPPDNYTSSILGGVVTDHLSACKVSGLANFRIGILRNVISLLVDDTIAPMIDAFEGVVNVMRSAGAIIIEDTDFSQAAEFWDSLLLSQILNADFVIHLEAYLKSLVLNLREIISLSDLRDFTRSYPPEGYLTRDTGI